MSYRVLVGDVLERLRELPDESVHCVVTSPPYWGLRDYGTGTWEGGDPDCDHKAEEPKFNGPKQLAAQVSGHASKAERHGRKVCHKCGATRIDQQIGLEATPEEFIAKMVEVFREVRRVLRSDGTCWVNMGDTYNAGTSAKRKAPKTGVDVGGWNDAEIDGGARVGFPGLKPKDLCGMPWMLAFALRADGWYLRQDIIWAKPNPMPESVTDRCTKAHEYIFLLTKSARYYYDAEAIKEPSITSEPRNGANSLRGQGANRSSAGGPANRDGRDTQTVGVGTSRNKRSVWEIATEPFPEAHFATFPTKLVEPCILAGTSVPGCCAKCGAPWIRVVDKETPGKSWHDHENDLGAGQRQDSDEFKGSNFYRNYKPAQTVGWRPDCACEADVVPCTVLDPFNGSGTTGLVALRVGRNYIGIELNPEYAAMAERRIHEDNPMFNVRAEERQEVLEGGN